MTYKTICFWGSKNNTMRYVFEGFKKAFDFLGYQTYWFDDTDYYDIGNGVMYFVTKHDADKIPLNKNNMYVLHNCSKEQVKMFEKYPHIHMNAYLHKSVIGFNKVNEYTWTKDNMIVFPWTTDLLPHEIDLMPVCKEDKKVINWVGTVWNKGVECSNYEQIEELKKALLNTGIEFNIYGMSHGNTMDDKSAIRLIRESIIAPAILSQWQIDNGFIPCRVAKNISYGQMGMTNSKFVKDIYGSDMMYSHDIEELVLMGIPFKHTKDYDNTVRRLMNYVRDNHTYVNRVESLIKFMEKL